MNKRAKSLVASDILVRSLKKYLEELLSKKMKSFQKFNEDDLADREDFFGEQYFKTMLLKFLNMLFNYSKVL